MSNSYTSPPLLPNTSTLGAGSNIETTTLTRIGDINNYLFAVGGTHNILSQSYADQTYRQSSTSFVEMSEWRIPTISNSHNQLHVWVYGLTTTTATGAAVRFTLTIGASSSNHSINLTSGTSSVPLVGQGIITHSPAFADSYATLKVEVQAATGAEIEIQTIMARWVALTSPIASGHHYQVLSRFTPFGVSRLGSDQPLSARAGSQMIENANTLRRRPRSILTWSGVFNAASSTGPTAGANGPELLGIGDIQTLFSYAPLFAGMRQDSTLSIIAHLKASNLSGALTITLFGQPLTVNANGWSTFTLTIQNDRDSISNIFGGDIYRFGLDNNPQNQDTLDSLSILAGQSSGPQINAVSIWSV